MASEVTNSRLATTGLKSGAPVSIQALSVARSTALGRGFSSSGGIRSFSMIVYSLDLAASPGITRAREIKVGTSRM